MAIGHICCRAVTVQSKGIRGMVSKKLFASRLMVGFTGLNNYRLSDESIVII